MAVYIDSILFNVDPKAGSGAINLRKDAFHSVALPEWHRFPEGNRHAHAAYPVADLNPHKLVIQAAFRCDEEEDTVWIEAQDASADQSNTLGSIPPFRVDFHGSRQRVITIPIRKPALSAVGFHDDAWHWIYRTPGGTWQDAGSSHHRIYRLLTFPNSPWDANSGNSYLWPWWTVLDFACEWAKGARSETEASEMIGKAVMDLGQLCHGRSQLRYDIRDTNGSFTDDSNEFFDCVEFLRTISGEADAIHKVDCSDVASMISIFANILGCHLRTVMLRQSTNALFPTNPVHPLGRPAFEIFPFPFRFHEFAFSQAGAPEVPPEGTVWDGCFFVDGDSDPANPPHKPIPGFNQRFGAPGDLGYLDRLVRPGFRSTAVGRTEFPNRSVTPMVEPAAARPGRSWRNRLAMLSETAELQPAGPPARPRIFIAQLFLAGIGFPGWTLKKLLFPKLANDDSSIDSFWQFNDDPDVLVRLQIDIELSIPEAQDSVIGRLMASSAPIAPQIPQSKASTLPRIGLDGVVVVDQIGNLSLILRNIGYRDTDLTTLFQHLRDLLIIQGTPETELGTIHVKPKLKTDIKIDLKQTDGSVWFKLFTSTGELFGQKNDVFYTPGDGALQAVDVYEMAGSVTRRHYRYEFRLP